MTKLNVYKKGENKPVATGTDDGVKITGLAPETKVAAGDYEATHSDENGKLAESARVVVPAFTVLKADPVINVPDAPTIAAAAGDAKFNYTLTAPKNNGGATVTGYTITYKPADGDVATKTVTALTGTIDGLTNDKEYTITAVATNSRGNSAVSAAVKATPKAAEA